MAALVLKADELRADHPGCGVEKMYYTLRPDFIGRNRFVETFMGLGYRLKHLKNYRRTTYAVFMIDVYTKKIVGDQVSGQMRALQMALRDHKAPKVHHSDRGSQYTYTAYIDLLKSKGCKISMANTAQANAYAERIHRTIKNDYMEHWIPKNFNQLKQMTKKAVNHYNSIRPHNHIGKISPIAYENKLVLKSTFQNQSITIFNNEN